MVPSNLALPTFSIVHLSMNTIVRCVSFSKVHVEYYFVLSSSECFMCQLFVLYRLLCRSALLILSDLSAIFLVSVS